MPRNVVTVVRRTTILPRGRGRRARQEAALAQIAHKYPVRRRDHGAGVEIGFTTSPSWREAKERVLEDLDEIEPGWRRLFVVYPTESALRNR